MSDREPWELNWQAPPARPGLGSATAPKPEDVPGFVLAARRAQEQLQTEPKPWEMNWAPPATPPAAPPPAEPQSFGGGFLRTFGMGTGSVVKGLGDILGVVVNPLNDLANRTGLPQAVTGAPASTNLGQTLLDATGLPQPQTPTERIVSSAQAGAASGIGGSGVGRLIAKAPGLLGQFGEFIGNSPLIDTVGGASGGASSQGSAEAGAPPWLQFLAGLGGSVVGGGATAVATHPRVRPVMPQELELGSLDGAAPLAGVDDILRNAGADPEQFSSPDLAELAAARVARARDRVPPNLSEAAPAGIGGKAYARFLETSQPKNRTLPGDVTLTAAPEGAVRSDDLGATVGLERKRAVDNAILDEGRGRAKSDPLVASILDSAVSDEMKAAAVWDRIRKTRADIEKGAMPDLPDVPNAPFEESTPEAASARVARDANPTRSRIYDITLGTESNGRRFNKDGSVVTSPKGARGEMQVMPGTSRDPGFGIRKSNGTLDDDARVGREYIDMLQKRYGGDMKKAWAGYNAGPGAVDGAISKYGAGWLDHMPAETRAYVNKNIGALGGNAPDLPYRAGDYSAAEGGGYSFDAFDSNRNLRRNTTDNMGAAEIPETFAERQKREASSPEMATGTSTRPFRAGTEPDDAFYEQHTEARAKEAFDKAQADLEAEWARREEARKQREANRGADERFQRERTRTEDATNGDPSAAYGNKYAQRPHRAGDEEPWAMTPEGFVAGKDGKPVAFRNAREAAKWAASNKMGGDFELHTWATNSERVVLRKRDGSTYGERPAPAAGPAEPPAGRSADDSQRTIEAPQGPERTPTAEEYRAPAPPERPPVAAATREPVVGGNEQVVTARGRPVDTRFEVHEARDLVSSDSPSFDPSLQPRDRANRSSSDAQIAETANRLDPEMLHSSRQASQGAPIVGPDRMVESGNGRVASIRRAYELHPERAKAYREMIEKRGHDTTGFDQPVLVRRRTTDLQGDERGAFVREANERDTMSMSSTEQAKIDSKAMTRDTLDLYRGGSIGDMGNRDFARRWINEVATPAERNTMVQPDGSLSADGLRRMRASLLAKAFDDADLVAKVVEDPDTEIRAIGNVLTDTAPAFAKLRDRIASGDLPREYDITHQVAEASNMVARARAEGRGVGDLTRQNDMFGGKTDPTTEAVARLMFKDEAMTKPRSANDMADALRFYTSEAEKHGGADMFGGEASPQRALDILEAARAKIDARNGNGNGATLFAKRRGAGESVAGETRPLTEALDRVAATTDKSNYAALAKALRPLVGDLDMHVGGLERGVLGSVTDTGSGGLHVRIADAGNPEVVLHEAIHVATMSRWGHLEMSGASQVARDFTKLFEDTKRAARTIDPAIRNGLENADEFLAYGLTNPKFQRWLRGRTEAGLWGRFVNGVRRILGIGSKYRTTLDDVLSKGADLLEAAKTRPPLDDTILRKPGTLFAKDENAKSWGVLGNLIFDPEFRSGDGAAAAASVRETFGKPKTALKRVGDRMKAFGEAAAYSNDSALRSMAGRFNSPTIAKLADMFHAESGKTDKAVGRTFDEAVASNRGRFIGVLSHALKDLSDNPASMGRIRDLLAQPDKAVRASAQERAAATKIRDLLKEVREYRADAGEAIGEVKDGYFPRMMRPDKVFADPAKFLAQAEKAYRAEGAKDPTGAATAWLERVMDGHLGITDGASFSATAGSSSARSREFGAHADEYLRDFYETNPLSALTNYLTGSIKRAEETRRFGPVGREGSVEREAWAKEHKDKTQWDVMRGDIRKELQANGAKSTGIEDRIETLRLNALGRTRAGSPRVAGTVSVVHAWNQLSTLGRAVFASLPEVAMGFVRGGPRLGFTHLGTTFGEVGRLIARADPSDAARYAEAVGAIGADNSLSLLRARADDPSANVVTSKILDQFYRKSGLEGWTRAGRTAAVKTGQSFVDVLAHDMVSPSARVRTRAAGYLRELGVTEPEAFAETVRAGKPSVGDVRADNGFAGQYATALLRFANQSVLMPTRSVKPSWASHPVGSLIFALQSYNYAFKKNVLDRVGRETVAAVKEQDPKKLSAAAGLAVLTGVTAMITRLRHEVYGGGTSDENQTTGNFLLESIDRAGLTGGLSPLFNAFEGLRYRRSVGQTLEGSVIGRTADGIDAIGGLATGNSDNTNSAERRAAGAVYDLAVKPAENAIGASVLRGGLGSAAILGTGAREGGALPSDKEWFVSALAGGKQDKSAFADDDTDETDDEGNTQ